MTMSPTPARSGSGFQALRCLVAASILLHGCRTAPKTDEETAPKAADGGFDAEMRLSGAESQEIYLKLLEVEVRAGVPVPPERIHSVSGVLWCRTGKDLASCDAHVRLSDRELASAQPLPRPIAERVVGYARQTRPDLAGEATMITDIDCDYVGPKSPPFNLEKVDCHIRLPRALGEAAFVSPVADELSELLRGDASFGNQTVTVSGAISCLQIQASKRAACTVRPLAGASLSDRVLEVSARYSPTVARKLQQALTERFRLSAGQPVAMPPETSEVSGALACTIDSLRLEKDASRRYHCRAKL